MATQVGNYDNHWAEGAANGDQAQLPATKMFKRKEITKQPAQRRPRRRRGTNRKSRAAAHREKNNKGMADSTSLKQRAKVHCKNVQK